MTKKNVKYCIDFELKELLLLLASSNLSAYYLSYYIFYLFKPQYIILDRDKKLALSEQLYFSVIFTFIIICVLIYSTIYCTNEVKDIKTPQVFPRCYKVLT